MTAAAPAAITGRLAISVTQPPAGLGEAAPVRSGSSIFELTGNPAEGAIALSTPLGPTVARASWSPAGVTLVSSDGERRFSSLEALGQELLGEPLPLAVLFDWLRGRPAPQWPWASLDGARGFEQLGWRVDLGQFTEGRIRLDRRGAVRAELRIVLDAAVH